MDTFKLVEKLHKELPLYDFTAVRKDGMDDLIVATAIGTNEFIVAFRYGDGVFYSFTFGSLTTLTQLKRIVDACLSIVK